MIRKVKQMCTIYREFYKVPSICIGEWVREAVELYMDLQTGVARVSG